MYGAAKLGSLGADTPEAFAGVRIHQSNLGADTPSTSPITYQFTELENSLGDLMSVIDSLSGHLQPVLNPAMSNPCEHEPEEKPCPLSDVANRVRNQNNALKSAIARLQYLNSIIEL